MFGSAKRSTSAVKRSLLAICLLSLTLTASVAALAADTLLTNGQLIGDYCVTHGDPLSTQVNACIALKCGNIYTYGSDQYNWCIINGTNEAARMIAIVTLP